MIFFLVEFLREILGFKVPAVFTYFSTRMILASLTALGVNIYFGPRFIQALQRLRIGQNIRTSENDCAKLEELHRSKKNTPTMGGVLILGSIVLSLLLWSAVLRFAFILSPSDVW